MRRTVAKRIRKLALELCPTEGKYYRADDGSIRCSKNSTRRQYKELKLDYRLMRTKRRAKRRKVA